MASREGRVALLIDDSRLDQLNTRGLLLGSTAGFTRLEWLDHWPGVRAAHADGPFDLYLVDMNLGADSGLDVIRDLRGAGIRAPIIALTGRDDADIDRACTDAGASDFLVKDRVDRAGLERSIRYAQKQVDTHLELDRLNAALERRVAAENDQARLMRLAMDQSSDAIFLTKAGDEPEAHAVVYVNAALCRLFGRRAGDMLGLDLVALFDAAEVAAGNDLDRALRARASFFGQATIRCPSGSLRVHVRATPLRGADDDITNYVWTCRDLADERASPRFAREPDHFETLGRITAGVAHDLNDRLTTMVGHLDLLAARHFDNASMRSIEAARRATDDMAEQARMLVALTHPDAVDESPVDVDALLDAIEPLVQHAVGRLVKVERRRVAGPTGSIVADPVRLRLALILLAAWTRAAIDDGGLLQIEATDFVASDAEAVRIAVPALDRSRTYVAITLRDAEQSTLDDATTSDPHELRRLEDLVAGAGGTLAVARNGLGRIDVTVFLPRAS